MNPITEDEYESLDLPYSSIDSQLVAIADILDIDPLEFIDAYDARVDRINLPDLDERYGNQGIKIMCELLDLAIESSTQLPHIRDGVKYLMQL